MIEVQWSPSVIVELGELRDGTRAGRHLVENELAPALLLASEGKLSEAEFIVMRSLGDKAEWKEMHPQAFTSVIIALFIVQRLDIASDMLESRYNRLFNLSLEFSAAEFTALAIRWEIPSNRTSRFIFSQSLLQNDRTVNQILAFLWTLPLFARYIQSGKCELGSVMVNLGDIGALPGLAFCDNRPGYFLVPDNLFISSRGYESTRLALKHAYLPWEQRRAAALWRGTTTGHPVDRSIGWRSLPRVALCEIGRRHSELIDAGITRATQLAHQEQVEAELRAAGYLKEFVPPTNFSQYKYQIDIDGNTNSWPGLFQKLLTGATVLKVESPGLYRQWYYDRLRAWYNYIPVVADMADLIEKIRWLRAHDDAARQIGDAGRALAESATLDSELDGSVSTITAALRYAQFVTSVPENGHDGDQNLFPTCAS
jgi:hypothetical protein